MLTVPPGLAGVVAFETKIAEPDRDGGALRYRGIDIEKLVGKVSYADVWGLLVDGDFGTPLTAAEPVPLAVHSGDIRADAQAAIATMAPQWGLRPLIDIDDARARADVARTSATLLDFVAQGARGADLPRVPASRVEAAGSIVERFMVRWRGEPDPRHVSAIDRYWWPAPAPTYRRPSRRPSAPCPARCTAEHPHGPCTWSRPSNAPATPGRT
jgi:citrate synthase